MLIQLKDNQRVFVRLLEPTDSELLFSYIESLSLETKSRFGPHAFDKETINAICSGLPGDTFRYAAIDDAAEKIIAYMLIKPGMLEWDARRYARYHHFLDMAATATYAPSVADKWQNTGLGSVMYKFIEKEMKGKGIKQIVLWGGVQSSNQTAVQFYSKHGYRHLGDFYHDGKDNYDMMKELT